MRLFIRSISIVLLVSILIIGCSTNKYEEFSDSFLNTYFDITNSIDPQDTAASLSRIGSEENAAKISKLKDLLDDYKSSVPNSMSAQYDSFVKYYEGLVFLQDVSKKWDTLSTKSDEESFDIKEKVFNEIVMIQLRTQKYKE